MDTFIYFAYGSNMLTKRLRARCPSAKIVGTAEAHGYKICFKKESEDEFGKSGKATLVKSDSHLDIVPGVLFQINRSELGQLDRAEAKDKGYYRDDWFPVTSTENGNILSVTYIAEKLVENLSPYNWYLALVVAGATQHKLPEDHIKKLYDTSSKRDTNSESKKRKEALIILEQTENEAIYSEITARAR